MPEQVFDDIFSAIVALQMDAISKIARLTERSINICQRVIPILKDDRLIIITIPSSHENKRRKQNV